MDGTLYIAYFLYFITTGTSWNGDEFQKYQQMSDYQFRSQAGCHIAGRVELHELIRSRRDEQWIRDHPGIETIEQGCFPVIVDQNGNVLGRIEPN